MFGLEVRRICKASHITIILFLPERVIFYDKQNPAREKKCQFTSSQPLRSKKESQHKSSTKLLSFLDFEKLDSSLIKFGYSEKARKFEKIFHLQFDAKGQLIL